MSHTINPNRIELAANIRKLIEDTMDLIQKSASLKSVPSSLVRARATNHVTDRVEGGNLETINTYEQTSIRALLAWAANEQKAPPETIKAVTEVRFRVDDMTQLPRRDYEDVIQFLIDLRIDEMKN